ncbi:MAG: amidohydrolase [Nocardioides sp.]|uniref:amidohydrolase n=1 Tax=Nocardioides sp. TaxID=35761 RepID=UPI0039E4577A
MTETVLYPARVIRTMEPARPTAEAVLVRGDRVVAAGSRSELDAYGPARVDERYAEKVLVPGFVEAHSHVSGGDAWANVYAGRLERTSPDGRLWPGCGSIGEVLDRLRDAEALLEDPDQPLKVWGFDPIYYPGERLEAAELDSVSSSRPIHVLHANAHLCSVNSRLMHLAGIDADTEVVGVVKDGGGRPTGTLQELAAMGLVQPFIGSASGQVSAEGLVAFAHDAVNNGVTTATDLASVSVCQEGGDKPYRDTITGDFPARISVFHFGSAGTWTLPPTRAVERLLELREESTDLLRMGHVKLMLDGSIQSFTARVLAPGYLGGQPNGIWAMAPEEFEEALTAFHAAGLLVHVHCNGDQATQLFVETMERVLAVHPRLDHRHTVTHSQMTSPAQYRRMAALGMGANVFANHIWAWGDQHMDITLGPDRAARMNAARTALDSGVPIALHSDTPVTPLGPLKTMQHAVTRRTPSDRVMGEEERITAGEALHAVTLGPAYLLKMDHEVGSIAPGKYADFAVLDEDPLAVPVDRIGAIRVFGTVVGGVHHAAATAPTTV